MKVWFAFGIVMTLLLGAAFWLWTPDRSRAELEARFLSNPQDYLKALPKASLITVKNLGHVPREDVPAANIVPVLAFLAG